ncbi:MAG: hypothetical protein LAQ30_32605 [Acidobacteriia bacterium]|nr:hypothetical protein [Terriglobia bacterium]
MTALVSVLLESSIRAAVLAAMVACLLPLARVRSSAVRHGVWTAVLCAMLLMPVLPYCLPSLPLPVSAGPPAPAASFAPAAPRAPVLPRSPAKAAVAAPLSTAAPEPARPVPQASASTSPVWPLMALGVYAAGVAWFLARFLIGWWSAGKVARSGAAVTELNAAAPVCESARVASPLIAGLLAPRIILPLT